MKLLDNRLYIEFSECVNAGIPENTLKSARLRNSNQWDFFNDPDDKRKVLIGYDKLKPEYRVKIEARYGNPYDCLAKQPIKALVKYDLKAEQYYLAYRFDENKSLPMEHVKKYSIAASWLNMLKELTEDKKALKRLLNLTILTFYEKVMEIFKTENIDLPTSLRRLNDARKAYDANGYDSLIDWRFGKKLAAKVKQGVSADILLRMIENGNQYDDSIIAYKYNQWAIQNEHEIVTPATVGVWRRKNGHTVDLQRYGNEYYRQKYVRQVKGMRPSFPLALVESDDNNLDWYFIDLERVTGDKHSAKYIAIVVIDSFNDMILGYAYMVGVSPILELVKLAYCNAMHYIKYLTGKLYIPHEIKTDNWGIGELEKYYSNIAHWHKTPKGSKNRGYIENLFGSVHWKRCMKMGANNYKGNNITARYRGVNVDALEGNKKDRLMIGPEAETQIESFFHNLRYAPQIKAGKATPSKYEEWMNAWNVLDDSKKRLITEEQYLLKFGFNHLPQNGDLPSLNNRGIEPIIHKTQYSYDIEGGLPVEHIGKKLNIYYDPLDMSRVLITDHDKVRLIGVDARLTSKAVVDHTQGSRNFLNSVIAEKKATTERSVSESARRKQALKNSQIDPEALLLDGTMVKEVKQLAESMMEEQIYSNKEYDDPFNQM